MRKNLIPQLRKIIQEVLKRGKIGYPPTDHLNDERTITDAVAAILKAMEKDK